MAIQALEAAFPLPHQYLNNYRTHQFVEWLCQPLRPGARAYSYRKVETGKFRAAVLVRIGSTEVRTPEFRPKEYHLPVGERLTLVTFLNMNVKRTADQRMHRAESLEACHQLATERLERAGFSVQSLSVGPVIDRKIRRKDNVFPLAGADVEAVLVVSDQQKAERAMVSGIGPKCVFGFGMPIITEQKGAE